jgi:rod shape-determining protein MreB
MLAGARETHLITEPTASALAVGLPVNEIGGSMIVDIGGGTSEVTVYSMGGAVTKRSLRVAGDEMDDEILHYVRNKYNLLIGQRMAEQVKIDIGSAYPLPEEMTSNIRGRNLVTGLPETLEVSSVEIREAISGSVSTIVETVKDTIDEVPPEIIADLMDIGICLCGGGGQLKGLDERLTEEVRIRAWVADDPMTCVARGAGMVLEDFDNLKHLLLGLDENY